MTRISILWGPLLFLVVDGEMIGRRIQEVADVYIKEYNVVDEVVRSLFKLFILFLFPMCPIVLGKALSSVPTIAMAKDLNGPKMVPTYNFMLLVCFWSTPF